MTFHRFTLENGLRVALAPRDTARFASQLRVYHGAAQERAGEEGLAHFLEHLVWSSGGAGLSADEADRLRNYAGYSNAVTNMKSATYHFSDMMEGFEPALELFKACVFTPSFDEAVIERERKRVLREIKDIAHNSAYRGRKLVDNLIFGKCDPRLRDIGGRESVVASATPESISAFHQRGYGPKNALLVIAGGIPLNAEDLIKKHFGSLPGGSGEPYAFSPNVPLNKPHWHELSAPELASRDSSENSSCALDILMNAPLLRNNCYHPFIILNEILGSNVTGLLHKRLSDQEGLAYYAYSTYNADENFGVFGIHTKVPVKRVWDAAAYAFEEMKRLQDAPARAEDFTRIKKKIAYAAARRTEDNVGVTEDLIDWVEHDMPPLETFRLLRTVSAEQVQDAARQFLSADYRTAPHIGLVYNPLYAGDDREIFAM